jgi:hypothetical protein
LNLTFTIRCSIVKADTESSTALKFLSKINIEIKGEQLHEYVDWIENFHSIAFFFQCFQQLVIAFTLSAFPA